VWVLEHEFGIIPPKPMHPEIGAAIQEYADEIRREVSSQEIYKIFQDTFVNARGPYILEGYWPRPDDLDPTLIHGELHVRINSIQNQITADGNGPISAFVHGLHRLGIIGFSVDDYHEQAVGKGADAQAVAYVPLKFDNGNTLFGVGTGTNIDQAAVRAIIAGLNRKASR
jgi:2-isopropylmalate synthase